MFFTLVVLGISGEAIGAHLDVPGEAKRCDYNSARPPLEQHPGQARGKHKLLIVRL